MRNRTTGGPSRRGAVAMMTLMAHGLWGPTPLTTARAAGHTGTDAVAALRECIGERDDANRLACFDRAAGALPAAAQLVEAAATGATPAPAPEPEERFGFRGELAREEHDRRKAAEEAIAELQARVMRVAAQGSGDFVITLDNGQMWMQIPTGHPARVKVDDAVTIRRAVLGSFLLSAPNARGVRVRRVK